MVTETTIRFDCKWCGKAYRTPASRGGQPAKCTACGADFVVPTKSEKPDPLTDITAFNCLLCATRITVPARHVGRKVKCPDCDRVQRVPPPEKPPEIKRPAALDGPQYELDDSEEQPWGVDLARSQPQYVAVACSGCGTHLQAEAARVGKPITCHECGAALIVPPPPMAPPRTAQPHDDGYAVDEQEPPPAPVHNDLFTDYASRPPAGYREMGEASNGKGSFRESRRQPGPAPLLSNTMGLFLSPGFVAVLLGLTFGVFLADGSSMIAIANLSGAGGEFGVLLGVAALAAAVVISVLAWCALSAYGLAVVLQSAVGARRVDEWPTTIPTEWFGSGLQTALALLSAAALGGATAGVVNTVGADAIPPSLATQLGGIGVAVSVWLCLPWVVLSQLEGGSMLCVFSPRLLRTLRYAPLSWIGFYTLTLLLAAAMIGVTIVLLRFGGPAAMLATSPLEVVGALLYARWLGLLAWVAGEATPDLRLDAA